MRFSASLAGVGDDRTIIGVDFGVTSAFAAVDYDGALRALESKRNWRGNEFLARVAEYAPTIIAGDTRPPAKAVKKTAATFRAILFTPKHSLTLEEKAFLVKDYAPKNAHERDALAAALKAWHSRENQLRKLNALLRRKGEASERERDSAAERVLKGTRMKDL